MSASPEVSHETDAKIQYNFNQRILDNLRDAGRLRINFYLGVLRAHIDTVAVLDPAFNITDDINLEHDGDDNANPEDDTEEVKKDGSVMDDIPSSALTPTGTFPSDPSILDKETDPDIINSLKFHLSLIRNEYDTLTLIGDNLLNYTNFIV